MNDLQRHELDRLLARVAAEGYDRANDALRIDLDRFLQQADDEAFGQGYRHAIAVVSAHLRGGGHAAAAQEIDRVFVPAQERPA